jgi:hypothetical protein
MLSPAVFANLRTGQAYLMVFATLTAVTLCVARSRDVLAGTLLGFTLMTKSAGLPLLVLLAVQRRVRPVVVAVLVCASGALLLMRWAGVEVWTRYFEYVPGFLERPASAVTAYQSTWSLFRHLCVADAQWNPVPAATCPGVAAVVPALLVATAVLVTIGLTPRAPVELWMAAGLCLSVLTVPVAGEHHFVVLATAMVLVLIARRRHDGPDHASSWWPWVVFAGLYVVPLAYTAQRWTDGWSALLAYPRLYSGWLLWALVIREMLRARRLDHLQPQ